jgi:2,3-bisphosphoglycerate-dependent phosphoglycerate mutase
MAHPSQPPQPAAGIRQNRFLVPPSAAELLLIRHGESEPAHPDSPFPLVGGHADPALAPEGHEQAQRVGERLAGAGIGVIYVTPLRRTAQTAAPLARRLGLTPQVEPGLREIYLGEWEGGLFRKHVAEGHPLAVRMWAEERWDVIPGAEASVPFAARVKDAITRLAARHPGGRVAVFAHGGVIGQVLALAAGSRPFAFITSDNGSISRLVVDGDRWVIRGFNDTAHLEPRPASPA